MRNEPQLASVTLTLKDPPACLVNNKAGPVEDTWDHVTQSCDTEDCDHVTKMTGE